MSKRLLPALLLAAAVLGIVLFLRARSSPDGKPTAAAKPPPSGPRTRAELRPVAARDEAPVDHADDPAGELRLEGQVVDEAEKPVAGARVAVSSHPPREVTTEGDGSFAVDGLLPREYTIEAHGDGAHAGPVALKLAATTEPVILRLRGGASVEVTVTDGDHGPPIVGATVALRGVMVLSETTGADGVARLRGVPDDWLSLAVDAPGFAPARRMLETTGAAQREVVPLRRGLVVSGRVVDTAGRPVAGARVLADEASQPFPVTDPRLDAVVTAADGAWRFEALAAGTYRFTASHATLASATSAPVTLVETPRERIEIRLGEGARLAGRVVDATGKPVAAATIRVGLADGGFAWRPAREAATDAAGRFALAALPKGPLLVVAQHLDASSAVERVEAGGGELVLRLDTTGAIAGTVVSSSGEVIPEAQILAEPEWLSGTGGPEERRDWRLRGLPRDVTDAGGRFELRGLPAGTYVLRAARPGASSQSLRLRAGVRAEPGARDVRLVVGADGKARGRVLHADGTPPTVFTVAVGDGAPVAFTAADDGKFTVPGPAGKHNLFVSGPGLVTKLVADVTLVEEKETDAGTITVEKGRSLSGRVVDATGRPVAGAKLAAGLSLTGTGSELNVPSEGFGVKETETDADGRFVLAGFAPLALVVVAERPDLGRARSVAIPRGDASVTLELVLGGVGALEGKILRDGAPLPSAVVLATPKAAARSTFFVMSGPDGGYRFDRLAADEYSVTVMIGGGGKRPKDMFSREATVFAGGTTRADVELTVGDGILTVAVSGAGGEKITVANVMVRTGRFTARTMGELWNTAQTYAANGSFHSRMAGPGRPVVVEGLTAGDYTACAVATVIDPSDVVALQKLMAKGDELPVACVSVTVAAGANEVAVEAPIVR